MLQELKTKTNNNNNNNKHTTTNKKTTTTKHTNPLNPQTFDVPIFLK